MKALKLYSLGLLIIFAGKTNSAFAQGTGHHLTMSLKNCSQTANTIAFDLMVKSDGTDGDDIRMNAVQFGVNFNTGILQPGASASISYINGTNQLPARFSPSRPRDLYSFPVSGSPSHFRIVESPCSNCTPGPDSIMLTEFDYRAGRFVITSTAQWVAFSNPNLSLQDATGPLLTPCAAVVFFNGNNNSVGISDAGTGDMQRSLFVDCNLVISSVNDLNEEEFFRIFPNPIKNQFAIHNITPFSKGRLMTINIYNAFGSKVYSETLAANRNEDEVIHLNVVSGVYFVWISSDEKQYTRKLVVE